MQHSSLRKTRKHTPGADLTVDISTSEATGIYPTPGDMFENKLTCDK